MNLFDMTDDQFETHLRTLAEKKSQNQHCHALEPESIFALNLTTEAKLRGLRRGFQLEIDAEDPCYAGI